MISYKQWKLLNESLGTYSLGMKNPQNMGLVSNLPATEKCDNCGETMDEFKMPRYMDDEMPMMKKKPFPRPKDDVMGDEEMGDEEMGDMEDMEGEEEEMGDEEMGDMEDMEGEEEEMGDEEEIDPDAEFEDEEELAPKKKKPMPMGNPHQNGPFMRFARKMKKEGCGDEDMEDVEMDDEETDDEVVDKKKSIKKGDELKFLQKKTMKKKMSSGAAKETKLGKPKAEGKAPPKGKGGVTHGKPDNQQYGKGKVNTSGTDAAFKKGCSSDKMCKKCKTNKMESQYARPTDFDNSESAFINSLKNMFGNPTETFSDGMKDISEDLLLHPDLVPNEPGMPQPLSNHNEPAVTESLTALQKRIAELEKQLKK
jgi:hypothetical protein